jgi:ABC-type glycerol-3-phosphate transport system permease component
MVLAEVQTGFHSANWGLTAAHALLMKAPVVVILLILQRALLRGATAGAGSDESQERSIPHGAAAR